MCVRIGFRCANVKPGTTVVVVACYRANLIYQQLARTAVRGVFAIENIRTGRSKQKRRRQIQMSVGRCNESQGHGINALAGCDVIAAVVDELFAHLHRESKVCPIWNGSNVYVGILGFRTS
jgi:hypothetical protein